ncbi:hypothetical protein [Xanthomonas sp. SS]|uniref:hypothetical protein n=1 Tax=Xanthomonas sp. SS TaxID=2724122 RepID=UPI00163A4A0F|nr:hypothetical protein [Xanthomonas sp. SS]
MRRQTGLIALLSALCAGCATTSDGTDTYSGEYFYNFEFAYLTPADKNEKWCINGNMSKAELPERWGISHVTVQGVLGPQGSYGNLGVCKRVLTVTKLIKASNMQGRE